MRLILTGALRSGGLTKMSHRWRQPLSLVPSRMPLRLDSSTDPCRLHACLFSLYESRLVNFVGHVLLESSTHLAPTSFILLFHGIHQARPKEISITDFRYYLSFWAGGSQGSVCTFQNDLTTVTGCQIRHSSGQVMSIKGG